MNKLIAVITLVLVACGGAPQTKRAPLKQSKTWKKNQAARATAWEREYARDNWKEGQRIRAMIEGADVLKACWYNTPEELVCKNVRLHRD